MWVHAYDRGCVPLYTMQHCLWIPSLARKVYTESYNTPGRKQLRDLGSAAV